MRTRLDEIVDEEILPEQDHSSAVDSMYRYQVMCAVERAFRHGVERAQAEADAALHPTFTKLTFKDVQPAPAEEKPYWIKFDGSVATRMEDRRKDPGWIRWNGRRSGDPRTNDKGHIVNADRRKGQRRSGCEWKAHGRYTRWLRHDNETWHTDAQLDRRSGNDRRRS